MVNPLRIHIHSFLAGHTTFLRYMSLGLTISFCFQEKAAVQSTDWLVFLIVTPWKLIKKKKIDYKNKCNQ